MAKVGNMVTDGGDPRLNPHGHGTGPSATNYKLCDPNVTFEEYAYYARLSREEEDRLESTQGRSKGFLSVLFPSKSNTGDLANSSPVRNEKGEKGQDISHMRISDDEWTNADRALRTATASAIFYLITTDILGPFGLPYAFASMGWAPGAVLFTIFGVLAGYSGYLLWQIFMGMDSPKYPIRSYGDMGYRLYGQWLRYLFNVLQGIQLLLNVGIITISNGEALSQAAKFKLCFAICCLVWAIAGFLFGQVRTLQKFGILANAAIWINIVVMIVTMVGAAHEAPNYAGAALSAGGGIGNGESVMPVNGVYPAIQHYANLPPSSNGFAGSVNGAMQAVFSYGGAMVFPEFMSEMRRPRDFLKGMWAAQMFIYVVYMLYGLFMYAYQGQYVINPSYLGISGYTLQTVGNVFAMVSAIIAAALYGNIGIKVLYNNVFVEIFHAPALTTKKGKYMWAGLIPIYWSIAFVIAAGIPDFSGLTGVVAAICILQFTYTFPPLLSIAYMINRNAAMVEPEFNPVTGQISRHDKGIKRMVRGFFAQRWYLNVWNIVYMLGALALAGLGAYGAIINLINAFAGDTVNSFVCKSPLDG